MADPNKPSKRVGLAGMFDNAARKRQRMLNQELGDNLRTKTVAEQAPKNQRRKAKTKATAGKKY